jgi:hypothetical protein
LGSSGLAWRPVEVASTEEMDGEMGDCFATVGAVVDDEAVAGGGYVFAAGDLSGCEEEVAEEALIIGLGGSDAGDGFFRNDEDMDRCLRRDVAEGEALVVFKNDVSRDFASDDTLKNGLRHERRLSAKLADDTAEFSSADGVF